MRRLMVAVQVSPCDNGIFGRITPATVVHPRCGKRLEPEVFTESEGAGGLSRRSATKKVQVARAGLQRNVCINNPPFLLALA